MKQKVDQAALWREDVAKGTPAKWDECPIARLLAAHNHADVPDVGRLKSVELVVHINTVTSTQWFLGRLATSTVTSTAP